MRGQYLLEQGRAGTRQADDEDRRARIIAVATPGGEKLRGAGLDQQPGVVLDAGGLVAAFGLFQRIAALVVGEGFGVFATILERLAERKAQVIAVGEGDARRPLLRFAKLQ